MEKKKECAVAKAEPIALKKMVAVWELADTSITQAEDGAVKKQVKADWCCKYDRKDAFLAKEVFGVYCKLMVDVKNAKDFREKNLAAATKS